MTDSTALPGERLEKLRESRKLSLRRAALLSEGAISHSHINDLEKGFASWEELSFARIRGLSRAYGMSPARLIEVVEGGRTVELEEVKSYRLPLALEGVGVPSWSSGEDTITLSLPDLGSRREEALFAVRMKDEAMAGYARKGDVVVVDTEAEPRIGDVVALQLPGKGLRVRRYRGFTESGRYLISSDGSGEVYETPRNSRLWGVAIGVWHSGS